MECQIQRNLQRQIKTGTASRGCYIIYRSELLLRQKGFHLTFLAVYLFLVHDIGKESNKTHSGIEKTTPRFLSQLRTVLFSCSIEQFILFSKSVNTQVRYYKKPTQISFSELTLGNSLSVWLKPQYEQHVIKLMAIYFYLTINQLSEARNILVPSVTAKSFKMQC